MSIYKSPLCSCIICRDLKSSKGIHSHYHIAHTTDGFERAQKNSRLGKEKSIIAMRKIKDDKIKKYNSDPNKCTFCEKPLNYSSKNKQYCNRSCAASHTNTTRGVTFRKKYPQRVCPISFCQVCKSTIPNKRVKYCVDCGISERKRKGRINALTRNFGGRTQSKSILYNGVYLGSTYELKVARSLDKNNIKWTKCDRFSYTDPFGKLRTYEPDFYLTDFDLYLDPKNDFLIENINPSLGFTDSEKIRIVENTHSIRVIILNKNELSWKYIKQKINPQ
jgi:hypothetical protein